MKVIKQSEDNILIELDPTKHYIAVVDPRKVLMSELYEQLAGFTNESGVTVGIIQSNDVEKAIKFHEIKQLTRKKKGQEDAED